MLTGVLNGVNRVNAQLLIDEQANNIGHLGSDGHRGRTDTRHVTQRKRRESSENRTAGWSLRELEGCEEENGRGAGVKGGRGQSRP